jgi:hypothetical protein
VIRRLVALLVAGLVLSACGSISAATALRSWVSQSGFTSTASALRTDAVHSATALRDAHSSSNDLHTVCAVMLVDTESANASLPTPDSQATTLLSRAYTNFGAGANQCYRAAANSRQRAVAIASLESAIGALSEATARIASASGS